MPRINTHNSTCLLLQSVPTTGMCSHYTKYTNLHTTCPWTDLGPGHCIVQLTRTVYLLFTLHCFHVELFQWNNHDKEHTKTYKYMNCSCIHHDSVTVFTEESFSTGTTEVFNLGYPGAMRWHHLCWCHLSSGWVHETEQILSCKKLT